MSRKVGVQLPRYEVDRRLERASRLIITARWWLAGVLLLLCAPLLRIFVWCGAPVLILPLFAVGMSQPLEDMAEDVRNRMPKPLIIWMILSGFLLTLAFALQGFAVFWVWRMFVGIDRDGDPVGGLIINVCVLLMMLGIAWTLWVFIRAWRGLRSLQEGNAPAFPVTPPAAPLPSTMLPPRPKR